MWNLKYDTNEHTYQTKTDSQGFPGGAVVKNLPADAGDTDSSTGPRTSYMPRSS